MGELLTVKWLKKKHLINHAPSGFSPEGFGQNDSRDNIPCNISIAAAMSYITHCLSDDIIQA